MSDLRIHAALSPRVAVLSSPDVDRVIQFNGIPDLSTLLRPFEFSVERLSVRTSQLETRVCDRFPLRFDPYSIFNAQAARAVNPAEELLDQVNQLIATNIKKWDAQVPKPNAAGQQHHTGSDNAFNELDDKEAAGKALEETLAKLQRGSLEETTPWFAAVQQLVFSQRPVCKHETFGHPVAVLLAVSSASPDPMNDFAKLYEVTSQASPFPAQPFINTDVLKYYVLIHDVRTSGPDLSSSKEMLEQIKKTYGLHCCLLAINSAPDDRPAAPAKLAALWSPYVPTLPTSPNPMSPPGDPTRANLAAVLDEEDVKRIKGFIRELTAQSIVPFMERYVQHMGEHLANSRRGLTNRLFGASRKLFGGVSVGGSSDKSGSGSSTPGGLATSGGYDAQNEWYPYTSIEAQTRRLADFAFTIRDYKLAASMYDLGRKDFAGDKAHRHSAAATEMFGLSHLMIMYTARSAPIDVDSYLAQACQEYTLRSAARAAPAMDENNALRATLLYYEAYRMLGYLRPAPAGLLRMSQRSDEVLAPLLLEQAALACLQLRPRAALRKYALHLVMAAHKYQACGQKALSLRCYANAAVVYRDKGWTLVENHIEHELGMQAYNDGDSDTALAHLVRLVRPSANSSVEHDTFLKAVQTAYKYSARAESSQTPSQARLQPPGPARTMFDAASASLRFVPESSASATSAVDEEVWERLEEQLVASGLGERTHADGSKSRRKRPTSKTSTQAREVPVGQTFWLEIALHNPLGVELAVDHIRPVLKHDTPDQDDFSDVETEDPGRMVLGASEHRRISVAMRASKEAKALRVASVTFRLADAIELVQPLVKKGQRLNATKEQRAAVVYGRELSLAVSVHAARPTLTARIVHAPAHMLLGEQARLKVVFKNEGGAPIEDVRALCDQPELATFDGVPSSAEDTTMANHMDPAGPEDVLGSGQLMPGEEVERWLVVRPNRTGAVSIAWLLPFSSGDGETYLSRLALSTKVSAALQINVTTEPERSTECRHVVTVEATNRLSSDEIRVDALSLLGPGWKLAKSSAMPQSVVIAPLQVWREQVLVEAASAEGGMDEYTATRLQDVLLSRDTRRARAAGVKLHLTRVAYASEWDGLMLGLHREARKVWRSRWLGAAFPTLGARDRRDAFTLWEPRDLDVVVHFALQPRTESSARCGQVAVYGLQPGPLRSQIRAITHPRLEQGAGKAAVRSLYAETIKEKATVLANILASRLNADQNPAVIHATLASTEDNDEAGGGTALWFATSPTPTTSRSRSSCTTTRTQTERGGRGARRCAVPWRAGRWPS